MHISRRAAPHFATPRERETPRFKLFVGALNRTVMYQNPSFSSGFNSWHPPSIETTFPDSLPRLSALLGSTIHHWWLIVVNRRYPSLHTVGRQIKHDCMLVCGSRSCVYAPWTGWDVMPRTGGRIIDPGRTLRGKDEIPPPHLATSERAIGHRRLLWLELLSVFPRTRNQRSSNYDIQSMTMPPQGILQVWPQILWRTKRQATIVYQIAKLLVILYTSLSMIHSIGLEGSFSIIFNDSSRATFHWIFNDSR